MLTTRQLVPPSVVHLACPLRLEDGSTVLLTATASFLHVRLPVWKFDSSGNETCVFVPTMEEMHIGGVAVALVACAHQCFVVLTQDCDILVARYQANLPAPPQSWLCNDVLHHSNAWIILYRGRLSAGQTGGFSMLGLRSLFAPGEDGTTVQCSVLRGVRHTLIIDIPNDASDAFFREKWVLSVPQSVGPFSYSVAPFKRDVMEQSDEELLLHCTVAELAKRKCLQKPPPIEQRYGFPPVSVTLLSRTSDDHILSMALMPATPPQGPESFVFVFPHRSSLSVFGSLSRSSRGRLLENLTVSGSPYLVLTLPDRILVLSLVGCMHVLFVFGVNATSLGTVINMVGNHRTMRVARSLNHPCAAVVQQGEAGEVLWMLLENGLLASLSIEVLRSCNDVPNIYDAPNIHSGDCEDGEWPIAHISGLPHGFRAISIVPFERGCTTRFQPHPVTERYVLLGDGVSDTYLVDLIERRTVGGLLSHGAMTSVCTGPGMDLVVTYSKGLLRRLSSGVASPVRVHAAFAGVHQMYALSHMSVSQPSNLTFHFLVTTAVRTAILRGAAGHIEELQDVEGFLLDEPTLAVHSAPPEGKAMSAASSPSLLFAQCTPTRLNLSGTRKFLGEILPGVDRASHACFAGDEFLAVADSQRVSILSIACGSTPRVIAQRHLTGDVSHLVAWRMPDSCGWRIASCLWSHEILVWILGEAGTKYHVLNVNAVVSSSFLLPDGGVGLTFIDRTVAVLRQATVEGPPTLTAMANADCGAFQADICLPVTLFNGCGVSPHFQLVAVQGLKVDLVALRSAAVVDEQLGIALSPAPSHSWDGIQSNSNKKKEEGLAHAPDALPMPLRCGFVLYFTTAAYYVLVMSDGMHITVWSIPELLPPEATQATPCRRSGSLQRGPVKYQETHALQLPFITAYDHRLTKAIYLPLSNTLVALTDRGEDTSIVSAVDAETFCVIDGLPMALKEIPICLESLSVSVDDAAVVGTAVQSAGSATDPTSGRLLVVHVKPLRISSVACITTGGVLDISVQGCGDNHLIAVASMDRVLVYRLAGFTLSLLCHSETRSACTTVALRYPFLSSGLYAWGAQYMKLLPEGRTEEDLNAWKTVSIGQEEDSRGNNQSSGSNADESRLSGLQQADLSYWVRWHGVGLTLKTCALEPTAFAGVHSQAVYGDEVARVDGERNLITVAFLDSPEAKLGEGPDTRVVGLEGGYSSMLTRCLRLPSRPLRVQFSAQGLSPWRFRNTPFMAWSEHRTAMRLVGPMLLMPCADGSLHCAGEIPSAFASPLLRLEQRITELYDTTLSFSRHGGDGGCGGGLHRTYHSVSFEAEVAVQSLTRVLHKQSFLCVDAIEEFFLLTRLTEMPDPMLTAEGREWVTRKKQLMDAHLKPVWEEYAGELQDVDVCDMLHLW
ncbi:hypothetical protein TraAM80_07583 [Trypanosoma rangeli]|uniref:Uncharacterized protein n=1 Tax=Trypanosoma rangeli TaxID=5698 RepID=A0A422N4U5_TRYRA|nr:uncharacterized protein TraAM80_07583 [Trypanosoma rangeli]RNF00497.1 hypothetical protein TraAM80_07583 [Trypanosoma rangeli]|eukprot:RNF00497.1 hypothetical protein TraAM80_07583 [Trypanosoma rangeli]